MVSTRELAENTAIPVIASGGVGSIEDVRAVRVSGTSGIEGVIIGKALYDGRIAPEDALKEAA